jgi:hypothetical protein
MSNHLQSALSTLRAATGAGLVGVNSLVLRNALAKGAGKVGPISAALSSVLGNVPGRKIDLMARLDVATIAAVVARACQCTVDREQLAEWAQVIVGPPNSKPAKQFTEPSLDALVAKHIRPKRPTTFSMLQSILSEVQQIRAEMAHNTTKK